MRIAWAAGVAVSLALAPAAQAGWIQHNEPSLGFSATFPQAPTREDSVDNGVKLVTFLAAESGTLCIVVVGDYPNTVIPDEETAASRDNFAKGVSAAVTKSKRITFPRGGTQLEAMAFDAESDRYFFRSTIIIEGQRVYQIAGGVPKPDGDDAELDACVGGLVLTSE